MTGKRTFLERCVLKRLISDCVQESELSSPEFYFLLSVFWFVFFCCLFFFSKTGEQNLYPELTCEYALGG